MEKNPESELSVRRSLTEGAMLALTPEAEEALSRDFAGLKDRLDAVVRSKAADGTPPAGPIHAEPHRVLPPQEAEKRQGNPTDPRGAFLLGQAARLDGTSVAVPRIV